MKRLMKILLGLTIGAAIALLFAPKSGRKLREQLIGGATGKLLPAAPVEFPEPEGERLWDAHTATAVAEPPVVEPAFEEPAFEEPAIVEEAAVVEEVVVEEPAVAEEEAVVEEAAVVEEEAEVVEEATSEDLRVRIEETRTAVETDIAQPFASVAAEEAVVEEAVVEEAAAEEAVVDEAAAEEAVVEEAPAREAVEGLVADMTSGPVAVVDEEASAEAAAEVEEIEAAAGEEAQVEKSVAEEPVAEEEPEAREDGTINQAEMRRRIEETRARLKAKAFDAMMSGESALLSRDSGDKPVPKGDDVKLDGELESTIDESLSQEEY